MMLSRIFCPFGLQKLDYRSVHRSHTLCDLCAGSHASGFWFSHEITQNNDFSFLMIIFYFGEMFLTPLSKIDSSIKQWYKMKSFAFFNLDSFIRVVS